MQSSQLPGNTHYHFHIGYCTFAEKETMRILFVCLGNICRSPLAHGILAHRITSLDLPWTVDSAGTSAWHAGEQPDSRSMATAAAQGFDISNQRARQFTPGDFEQFDLIITMDRSNYKNVMGMARKKDHKAKVRLMLDYLYPGDEREVPDPYWDDDGFNKVYEMLSAAIDQLIDEHKPM